MNRSRGMVALGTLVGAGLLTGCCLFIVPPTVQLVASTELARVGETVTFVAVPTGGSGAYAYEWTGAIGQGPIATVAFESSGEKLVAVTVTDSCGRRSQQAQTYVDVEDDALGELTGLWEGELAEDDRSVFEVRLLVFHRGNTLQGSVYHGGRVTLGAGSVIGDQVMFQFSFWSDTTRHVVLTGTLNAARSEMSGTWGGSECSSCTWHMAKI